jgi:hypothetical protein
LLVLVETNQTSGRCSEDIYELIYFVLIFAHEFNLLRLVY